MLTQASAVLWVAAVVVASAVVVMLRADRVLSDRGASAVGAARARARLVGALVVAGAAALGTLGAVVWVAVR
ncbi:hypothetical protein [Cellulomonas hominis]|uniref:hypothetical protein n=1 Tax=Cellulomonas hominis TaxID=156981 RepID=UPI001B99FBB6|nr:hypothetical protein [Cellulomonas hominis]VTR75375.1 hypothetical protein CHMI_00119 [Cellulomonas hominis]